MQYMQFCFVHVILHIVLMVFPSTPLDGRGWEGWGGDVRCGEGVCGEGRGGEGRGEHIVSTHASQEIRLHDGWLIEKKWIFNFRIRRLNIWFLGFSRGSFPMSCVIRLS
jgi:hypothetical protein